MHKLASDTKRMNVAAINILTVYRTKIKSSEWNIKHTNITNTSYMESDVRDKVAKHKKFQRLHAHDSSRQWTIHKKWQWIVHSFTVVTPDTTAHY